MYKKLKKRHDDILQTMKKYQQDILNKFMAEARTLYEELKVLQKSGVSHEKCVYLKRDDIDIQGDIQCYTAMTRKFLSYAVNTFESIFEDKDEGEFAIQDFKALCQSKVYKSEIAFYYGDYNFYELEWLCGAYQGYEKAIEELEVACIV